MKKRLISAALAALLLFSVLPLSASASSYGSDVVFHVDEAYSLNGETEYSLFETDYQSLLKQVRKYIKDGLNQCTKKAGEISSDESRELKEKIKACLEKSGYEKDDVIISTLTYDGDSYGTETVVPFIESAITDVQREYKGLYFTTINISK